MISFNVITVETDNAFAQIGTVTVPGVSNLVDVVISGGAPGVPRGWALMPESPDEPLIWHPFTTTGETSNVSFTNREGR